MTTITISLEQQANGKMLWQVVTQSAETAPAAERELGGVVHEFLSGYMEGFLDSDEVIQEVRGRVQKTSGN